MDEMPQLSAQKDRGGSGAAVGLPLGTHGMAGTGWGGEIPTNAHSARLPPRSAWCG